MIINIKSPRLNYRQLRVEDSELIVNWRNSSRLQNVSHVKKRFTLEEHQDWFFKTRERRRDIIFSDNQNDLPIGMISLERDKYEALPGNCFELSKFIGNKNFSGKGLALEATNTVLNFFKKSEDVDFFFAITRSDNVSNIRLNEKVGFEIEVFPNYLKYDPTEWIFMKMKIK
tara:strand:- start:490 stop:1005 length:516 start_codon:yes stop_codon:yes gene_type:complete